jgi:predicted RecA/RadA family phage recombinase
MKNFIQPGETITIKAATDLKSGLPVMIGNIFGVACNDALKDQAFELKLTGVFSLQKIATEIWAIGELVYWNEVEKALTIVADNNQLVGVSLANAANPSSFCHVRLNGVFSPRSEFKT